MAVEDRPEHLLTSALSIENDPPLTYSGVLRQAIDDLFTSQGITEKLQGLEDDEAVASLIEGWKQGLLDHLEETTTLAVENFLTDLAQLLRQREEISAASTESTDVDDGLA
jgi:hypothetical protein